MRLATSALTLVLAAGLASCDAAEPLAPVSAEAPQAAIVTADAQAAAGGSYGAVIINDETIPFFIHFDAKRGLMSVHGAYVQLCAGDPFTSAPRMIVNTPSAISQRLVKLGEDEQPVVVYRTATGALSCALINSLDVRVASGMVHHDQVFTLASFKATWRGPVTGPDGSTHNLAETYQLTADIHDPNNPDLWSLNASEIIIR